jgi:hypothetical protein
MWSRDLNETIEIDSGTSYGLYDFSPSSAHLVYYRHLEASGLGLIGKLYAMRTDTEERDRLADKAWTESHAPEFTFLSDGLHVAYKASACGWYNNLRVVNLATQTVTTIEGATCGARYAQPDGGGLVFDAVEPSRLMEYSLDNKQTIQLATDPISQQSSPNGVITVHTLKPDAASVATVLLTNWDSRTVRTITSPGADLSIQHITNTHAVFKTTDSTEGMPTQLWLVELPQ